MTTAMLLLFHLLLFSFAAGVDAPEDDVDRRFDALLNRFDELRDVQQTIASNLAPVLPSGLLAALLLFPWCAFCARRIAAGWRFFSRWIESISPASPTWSRALQWCAVLVNRLLEPFRIEEEHERILAAAKAEAAAALQEVQRDLRRAEQLLAAATQRAERAEQEVEALLVRSAARYAEVRVLLDTMTQHVTRLQPTTTSEV